MTKSYLTEEQVLRDYPECAPKPLLETLQVHQLPDTAAEVIEAFMRSRSQCGPGRRS